MTEVIGRPFPQVKAWASAVGCALVNAGTFIGNLLSANGLASKASAAGRDAGNSPSSIAEHESLLSLFVEHAPAAIAMFDREMNYLAVSRRWREDYNLKSSNLVGHNHYEIFPEIPERWRLNHQSCLAGASQGCYEDFFVRDGKTEWVKWEIHPWRGADGRIGGIIIFTEVITQRKQTAQALLLAETRYRKIFEESIVGIFQSAPDGRYLNVNPALAHMFGYDSPQQLLEDVRDIGNQLYVDSKRRDEFKAVLEREGVAKNFECEVYRKDGKKIWLSVNARAVYNDGVLICYEGTNVDITERKILQEQLAQAQKMEAIGRLAGGIAHDFNNAIGVAVGYGALLKERVISDETSYRYADEIGKAAQRAATLTRQLLIFSDKHVTQPVILDLNTVTTDLEKMLRRLIGEDIEVVLHLDPSIGRINADPGQIEQILMNLAVNARDAMPRGGRLVLETANAELDDTHRAEHPNVEPGSYVMFSMTDNGCGMDDHIKSHLFEPFFTTKEAGKGTGLGLSTVYGIVSQNRGHIWVYSEPGEGTCFKVYLPRVDAALLSTLHREDSAAPGGTETILVVEDDASMRELTRTCLESSGYRVINVPNGDAAIDIVSQCTELIHLLITDVVMPGMSGRALADSIAILRPTLKVMYMSGYTNDLISRHGVVDRGIAFVEKPFTKDSLLRKVRAALDSRMANGSAVGG